MTLSECATKLLEMADEVVCGCSSCRNKKDKFRAIANAIELAEKESSDLYNAIKAELGPWEDWATPDTQSFLLGIRCLKGEVEEEREAAAAWEKDAEELRARIVELEKAAKESKLDSERVPAEREEAFSDRDRIIFLASMVRRGQSILFAVSREAIDAAMLAAESQSGSH